MPADFTLAVFAQSPTPRGVKTHLRLSPEASARLYAAFVRDTLSQAACLDLPLTVYHDAGHLPLKSLAPTRTLWAAQEEGDLGERLARVPAPCLILGTDTPHLPVASLRQALAAIPHYDVVLGPNDDNGYYCIGLQAPQPHLFNGIAWGGDQVLTQLRARTEALNLTLFLLTPFYGISTRDDLRRLKRRLEEISPGSRDDCPATRAVLKAFAL